MFIKRKLLGLILLTGAITLTIGCSANNDKDNTSEPKSKEVNTEENDLQELFAEADEVAMEYYKAGFENDIPKMYEMLSPKGQEKFLEGNYISQLFMDIAELDQLIIPEEFEKIKQDNFDIQDDNEDFFKDFNKLKEEYEVRRYDEYFDKEKGEVVYYVTPWSKYDGYNIPGDSNFIVMKQNPEDEWNIKEFKSGIKNIDIEDVDDGIVIHEYQETDEKDEDEYDFD